MMIRILAVLVLLGAVVGFMGQDLENHKFTSTHTQEEINDLK